MHGIWRLIVGYLVAVFLFTSHTWGKVTLICWSVQPMGASWHTFHGSILLLDVFHEGFHFVRGSFQNFPIAWEGATPFWNFLACTCQCLREFIAMFCGFLHMELRLYEVGPLWTVARVCWSGYGGLPWRALSLWENLCMVICLVLWQAFTIEEPFHGYIMQR